MEKRRKLILGAVELMLEMPIDRIHNELGDGFYVRMCNSRGGLNFHGEVDRAPDRSKLRKLLTEALRDLDADELVAVSNG